MNAIALTHDQFLRMMEENFGDAGIFATETSCLTPDDLSKGFDHCLERITPALEEELMAQGEL